MPATTRRSIQAASESTAKLPDSEPPRKRSRTAPPQEMSQPQIPTKTATVTPTAPPRTRLIDSSVWYAIVSGISRPLPRRSIWKSLSALNPARKLARNNSNKSSPAPTRPEPKSRPSPISEATPPVSTSNLSSSRGSVRISAGPYHPIKKPNTRTQSRRLEKSRARSSTSVPRTPKLPIRRKTASVGSARDTAETSASPAGSLPILYRTKLSPIPELDHEGHSPRPSTQQQVGWEEEASEGTSPIEDIGRSQQSMEVTIPTTLWPPSTIAGPAAVSLKWVAPYSHPHSLPSKQNKRKRQRTTNDSDNEDGNNNSDGDGHRRQDKAPKPKRQRKPRERRCDFCRHDPVGQQMDQATPCDVELKYRAAYVECTNCADYRSLHPGVVRVCRTPNTTRTSRIYRKYGIGDPYTYDPVQCDQCRIQLGGNICNVDSILGYSCTKNAACRRGRCTINGRVMETRPNIRTNIAHWMRHACQACENRKKSTTNTASTCSHLFDRSTWGQPCEACIQNNRACFNNCFETWRPQVITLPRSWYTTRHFFQSGFLELRGLNIGRKWCVRCRDDNHHCRVDASAIDFACNRCSQLGIDCVDGTSGIHYPFFNLAQVGFGNLITFMECKRCGEHNRRCDLQRPCDSCVKHGDDCDTWVNGSKNNINCFRSRLSPAPGPLYYLALGYGPGGVDDIKDGSSLEHWIGPATPISQMTSTQPTASSKRGVIAMVGRRLREDLFPEGPPPHGVIAQGGTLRGLAYEITPQQLADMVRGAWPTAPLPNSYLGYGVAIANAQERIGKLRRGENLRVPRPYRTEAINDEDGSSEADGMNGDDEEEEEEDNGVYNDGVGHPVALAGNAYSSNFFTPTMRYAPMPLDNVPAPNADGGEEEEDDDWMRPSFLHPDIVYNPVGVLDQNFETLLGVGESYFDAAAPVSQASVDAQPNPFGVAPAGETSEDVSMGIYDFGFDLGPDPYSGVYDVDIVIDPRLADMTASGQAQAAGSRWADFNTTPDQAIASGSQVGGVLSEPGPSRLNANVPPTYVPFGHHRGVPVPNNPFRKLLENMPLHIHPSEPDDLLRCVEITDQGVECQAPVSVSSTCQCRDHGDFDDLQPVCDTCSAQNAVAVTERDNSPMNFNAIMSMRAYFCIDCAAEVSLDADQISARRQAGVENVWGRCGLNPDLEGPTQVGNNTNNNTTMINFRGDALPVTGCACGVKLFLQRSCSYHRGWNADVVATQTRLMQEWRRSTFGFAVCPGCLVDKTMTDCGMSADEAEQLHLATPKAWACMACGDWVVNQQGPKILPGWKDWFLREPATWP